MKLNEFFNQAQQELLRANQDRRHPFRTLVLATISDFPQVRTVVKRKSLPDHSVLVYTDSRTTKIANLRENTNCSLIFYHPKKKLQVTFYCTAELIESGEFFEKHQAIALVHPNDYATTAAPKSTLDAPEYLYAEETHFTLLKFHPQQIEILQLGKPKHLRAVFIAKKTGKGLGSFLKLIRITTSAHIHAASNLPSALLPRPFDVYSPKQLAEPIQLPMHLSNEIRKDTIYLPLSIPEIGKPVLVFLNYSRSLPKS